MSAEWKPGDVALVDGHVALVWDDENSPRMTFVYTDSDGDSCSVWAEGSDARPLAVIDPEDREQVERLLAEFCRAVDASDIPAHPQGWSANAMQAALREFANPTPPKPAEPTGLGAVVEDVDGSLLVRIDHHKTPWVSCGGTKWSWDYVDAARVLSEGLS